MNDQDRVPFAKVLAATLDAYGRRPPMSETIELWFQIMRPFALEQFRMACQRHVMESPKEPPTPGAILQMLRGKDTSRPGAEEAWSIAVKACDESETVMMTDEIAQAWGVAQPIFNLGDEVGARMAFKEAYTRLTASPEAPAKWWPSIGHDPHKRDTALAEAKRQGLLSAPHAETLALPNETEQKASPEGLKRFKEEMAKLTFVNEARAAERAAEAERERLAVLHRKQEIADVVAKYEERGNES